MFSEHTIRTAKAGFEKRLALAGDEKKRDILARLNGVQNESVAFAIMWLYANSPLSDLANYDFDLFYAHAEHGVFLRTHSPYAKDMAEDIFLNYVLHSRVNEEELCDCRKRFYDELHERIRGMACYDAVIEINYWNAEHMMYQATDARTISALNAYRSAYGRCGEESSFGVNVFRAVGIAARQIYTPRWAHCDDNHAWVEVLVEGQWHFLGACEPEEILDKAWFTDAAGRAMLIHSRCFGDICKEECIGKKGMALFLNNLKTYAKAKALTVHVKDPNGNPLEKAEVSFGILNYSSIFPAAEMLTDKSGEVRLTCGLGSLFVRVCKEGIACERLVDTRTVDRVEITLVNDVPEYGVWQDFAVTAPKDNAGGAAPLTAVQKQRGAEKTAAANEKRAAYVKGMFDPRRANHIVTKYGYSKDIYQLMEESRGNFEPLLAFLADEQYTAHEKEMLLNTLSQKDRRDVDTDILQEALALSSRDNAEDETLFYSYVACPRIQNEPLSKWRTFISGYFTKAEKAVFTKDPRRIWAYIEENIDYDAAMEYGQIVTLPMGALSIKKANPLSKKILFVAVCRTLGIAARLSPVNGGAEYYENGAFQPLKREEERSAALRFEKESGEDWQYGPDFAFARLLSGAYQPYRISDEAWVGHGLSVAVEPGIYRVMTDNRLPNGDIHASSYHINIKAGETKAIKLRKFPAGVESMLAAYSLAEFTLKNEMGQPVPGSELTRGGAVLMWLETGREPTEHILNEMLESEADFQFIKNDIVFILESKEALENEKLQSVLKRFEGIRVCYDSGFANVEALSRRLYVDPEKLPLVVVTDSALNAVYASSGYNVGSGQMIVRICAAFQGRQC